MTAKHLLLTLCAVFASSIALAEVDLNKTRPAAIDEEVAAEPIPDVVNSDIRPVRNYPDQPPMIPHKTDNYQIDLAANKCLTCHSRAAAGCGASTLMAWL